MSLNKYSLYLSFLIISLLLSAVAGKSFAALINDKDLPVSENDSSEKQYNICIDTSDIPILQPSAGIQFYKEGIIFLSSSKYERRMLPEHISFGKVEAYYSPLDYKKGKRHKIFSSSGLFAYPCDALTFIPDYKTMYLTKFSEKYGKEKIFKAVYTEKGNKARWKIEDEPLEFCRDTNVYMHPALSDNGLLMVFSSDRAGSEGGMDLFISKKLNGSWSEPINAGKIINTSRNEISPFLDKQANLYFSSDGHKGYGAYDIYMCRFDGDSWSAPLNLGSRINSEYDELAFRMDKTSGQNAFFSIKKNASPQSMQLMRIHTRPSSDLSQTLDLSKELFLEASAEYEFLQHAKQSLSKDEQALAEIPVLHTLLIIRPHGERAEADKAKEAEDAEIKLQNVEVVKEKERIEIPEKPEKAPKAETDVAGKAKEVFKSEEQAKAEKPADLRKEIKTSEASGKKEAAKIPEADDVIYKVQFLSAIRPQGITEIILNGEKYEVNEYFYKNEYRYTVGSSISLGQARVLQKACRQAGYKDAFVAAFKNGKRSLDIELFKRE